MLHDSYTNTANASEVGGCAVFPRAGACIHTAHRCLDKMDLISNRDRATSVIT